MPALLAALLLALPLLASASLLELDARQAPPPMREGLLRMGTAAGALHPAGQALLANDRHLHLAGRALIPVMGEFHYARVPRAEWAEQLRKLKAAGVSVVASYVIWRLHEPAPGRFDWQGDLDLRHFVQLANSLGLQVFLRPGPWVHAELRYGGLPDWLVESGPTRRDDPAYLARTQRYFAAFAQQVGDLLWKQGGPVIGLQIENEYNRAGPLQGAAHIATLKSQLLALGLDVPLYTVTGWDHALWPRGEVIPVFGSYVDEPWSASRELLPPRASYLFQFGVRNEQGLGAQGRTSREDHAARDADITPFFGAEYGGGVPQMYRRRPLIDPQDIAAMVLTKLGSGVNLLGYYMFQGGQNPGSGHEETIASGGYNDVPQRGYDFQAPLGQYGQASATLAALRPLHLFLQAFGERLAPMAVYAPAQVPSRADDLQTLRWAVRSDGRSAFLFVNNRVRQHATPAHEGVQFRVQLPGGETITLPRRATRVAPGQAFIWPLRLDLSGIELRWATAQPLTTIPDAEGELFVFSADTAPEFVFRNGDLRSVSGARTERSDGLTLLRPEPGRIVQLRGRQGQQARLVWLPTAQAQQLARLEIAGRPHLVLSAAHAFGHAGGGIELRQMAPGFRLGLYPAPGAALEASLPLQSADRDGLFSLFTAQAPALSLADVQIEPLRAAGRVPPLKPHGPRQTPVPPTPEAWGDAAAAWQLRLPDRLFDHASDVVLELDVEGDVARLFDGAELLDDSYWIGRPWRIGLKRYAARLQRPLTLGLLPLRADAALHFDPSVRPDFGGQEQIARLRGARLQAEYALVLGGRPGFEVALTIDDLPVHGALPPGWTRERIAQQMLQAVRDAGAPEIWGFVNAIGVDHDPGSEAALLAWRRAGQPLGNHTRKHSGLSKVDSLAAWQADAVAGEPLVEKHMGETAARWMRFPYLDGGQGERGEAARAWLQDRGYRIADVSFGIPDWDYNKPFARCSAQGDTASLQRMREHALAQFDAALADAREHAQQLHGRAVPQVLLLHAGAFTAELLPALLQRLRDAGARFARLDEVQADPAYAQPGGGTVFAREARRRGVQLAFRKPAPLDFEALCR